MALSVGRLAALDRSSAWFYAVVTLLPWLLLPVWAVLLAAVVSRRRAAAVVALGVVGLHLVWMAPALRRDGGRLDPREDDLAVVAVNAQRGNAEVDEFAERLAGLGADAVVITELTPDIADAVDRALPPTAYPGRAVHPEDGFFGAGIYTRAPLDDRTLTLVDGRPTPLVRFRHDGASVALVAVHTIQPLADVVGLRRGLDDLAALRADDADALLLAGDFNATHQHEPFRRLLERTGHRDAHHAVGRGLATTWPARARVPPFALLDHVLVSEGVHVVTVREVDAPGSDHRAVVVRIRV